MISKELLKKYEMNNWEETNYDFYFTFLTKTDYLAMKLAEGVITREDKKAEFDARDFARAEINRLQSEEKVIN